ncbi:hypothetical protein OC834_006034 [Tilletia horrida]|nr:hypothetical protein OC834_006034 [Tilletia horrida]
MPPASGLTWTSAARKQKATRHISSELCLRRRPNTQGLCNIGADAAEDMVGASMHQPLNANSPSTSAEARSRCTAEWYRIAF